MAYALDFESRANRFLDAMACIKSMLAGSDPSATVPNGELAQLLDLLSDEARAVVIPSRLCANDDGDEDT